MSCVIGIQIKAVPTRFASLTRQLKTANKDEEHFMLLLKGKVVVFACVGERASLVILDSDRPAQPNLTLIVSSALSLFPSIASLAAEEVRTPPRRSPPTTPMTDTPQVTTELETALRRLKMQIAQQRQRLNMAQTDHERLLLQDFIRMLQEERRTLEELFAQITGKNADVIESAQEQQSEHRAAQSENVLEERAKP